jgi:hypothetical protein
MDLLSRFPDLRIPITFDAVAALAARLRDDLSTAEAALTTLRQEEIAALEARLAALRGSDATPAGLGRCRYCQALRKAGANLARHEEKCPKNPLSAILPSEPPYPTAPAPAAPAVTEEPPTQPVCRYCGKVCRAGRSLTMHEQLCAANPNGRRAQEPKRPPVVEETAPGKSEALS